MQLTTIETYTGQLVDLSKPNPDAIRIEDIAWQLSRIPRFLGATNCAIVYSVAQHSVLVLSRVKQLLGANDCRISILLCALLHDAHEAYMGDFPAPASELLDLKMPIKRLKGRLQRSIYLSLLGDMRFLGNKKFVPYIGPEIVDADMWARAYEAYHLMQSRGRNFIGAVTLTEPEMLRSMIVWEPAKAYTAYLNHYRDLVAEIKPSLVVESNFDEEKKS